MWIHLVPKEVLTTVSDTEKKRQEAINEVIYTERDFVRDMEYLRDVRSFVNLQCAWILNIILWLDLDCSVEKVGHYTRASSPRFP